MFGIETKKKNSDAEKYELEKQLADHQRRREIQEKSDMRIQTLKNTLRQGVQGTTYESFSLLLQGYVALKRVINKVAQNM